MLTVLVSGGHLTPALAVIDQSILEKRKMRFVFLGRKYSQENTKQIAQEQAEVEKRNVVFIETVAPKFHKTYWWKNLFEMRKFPRSLRIAWQAISQYKPDLFLSFGGYLAFPIALVCRIRKIPVITHEQTVTQGLANQAISFLSDKVAVSHQQSLKLFPKKKSVLTGNPIRPMILNVDVRSPDWVNRFTKKPILYITGGNQGSEILNRVVEQNLRILTTHWYVIHQCGNPSKTSNYKERLELVKAQLPKPQQKNYVVRTWVEERELAWIYHHATVAVSRSGANTIQELTAHHLPSVLIPLPFSRNNEQQKNAEMLSSAGSALLLLQRDLTPESFMGKLTYIQEHHEQMVKKAVGLQSQMILDGATNVLNLIEKVVS